MFNMKKKLILLAAKLGLTVAIVAMSAGTAQAAALLGQEPAPSFIVSAGGYEWVYAAPCAGEDPSCGVVQLHHSFSFATDAQWNASFANIGALVAAFTLPSGATNCAATYFDVAWDHCDMGDTQQGYIWHSPLALDSTHRNEPAAETFLIRAANNNHVPEPASLALVGIGLAGLGALRRRKLV